MHVHRSVRHTCTWQCSSHPDQRHRTSIESMDSMESMESNFDSNGAPYGRGVNGIAPSIAQDRRRAELHGAMSFVSLRHREVELLPKGNFWSHFLAVSCHRALLKRRYLDSTTSNLENWVLFFPEKGGGCTENERQKWRVDQWRIYSHTWSGAVGWSHTGVDGARHRCAQWGGDRLVCHQSNTQCTQRVVKKVGRQSTNFGSLYLGHFLPHLDNSPLIRFLLSCWEKKNKSGNRVFRIIIKSPEVLAAKLLVFTCHALRSSSARRRDRLRVRTRRRVGSTRCRGNHMHDHSRFQRDINDVTGVSLSLSLSLYLSQKSLTHNIGSASALPIILKTIGNRKGDCAWSCSRWQTQPEKICKSQRTNQCHSLRTYTDLCFAICRFSQVVFVTSNNFTHNLLFYFQ